MAVRRLLSGVKGVTEKIRYGIRKKPDVIIFGEIHISEMDAKDQAKAIQKIKPEYVLHENLDRAEPEELERMLQIYKGSPTLSKISKKIGVSLEDSGLSKDAMADLKKKTEEKFSRSVEYYKKSFKRGGYNQKKAGDAAKKMAKEDLKEGILPKNYKQLIQTPLYKMNPNTLSSLEEIVQNKIDQYLNKKEFGMIDGAQGIQTVVGAFEQLVKCDFQGQKRRANELYHACAQVGAKLAGCDIEKEIPKTDFPADEKDPEKIAQSFENMRKSLEEYMSNNNPQREMEMGKRIAEYAGKRKTAAPIIAIVGKEHTREGSGIYDALNKAGLSYKVVRQKSKDSDYIKGFLYVTGLVMK